MKLFSGFPNGKLQVTPLPNLFFSELLPAIDDLAELKLTLHLFWLFAHAKNRAHFVSARELRADATLVHSLAAPGNEIDQVLARALARATARGTLLRLDIDTSGQRADEALYFLNTEAGRRAYEKAEREPPESAVPPLAPPASERPNIFVLYEQNIGLLTPMIVEELKDAEQEYPVEWIRDAFKEAVERNARNWSYIRKILQNRKDGRGAVTRRGKTWYGDEYGKYVKR